MTPFQLRRRNCCRLRDAGHKSSSDTHHDESAKCQIKFKLIQFNTDQGSQFTSLDFTGVLKDAGITISMDGRGRCLDNIFIERLWRSLKYEAVYLHEMTDGFVAQRVIGEWIGFYNTARPHSALDGRTPAEAYWARGPMDMMDKADALPTSPQAQQQQKSFKMNRALAA